ncbi:MAG: BspA family leucine-rich repeat surface protein [Ruminococcus sp.]|nr:BspA family leucine-rich repeat surface protein [Ruminococcus sp.]
MENKFMKKTLAAVFAIALLGNSMPLSGVQLPLAVPMTVNAAEKEYTSLRFEEGVLTLYGNVVKSEVKDFKYRSDVELVVCEPETILPSDSSGLFSYFRAKEIDLSNATEYSSFTSMRGMFESCEKLVTLNIDGIDTTGVTDMGNLFKDCESLKSIDLFGFDTSQVKKMEWMFANCKAVTNLDLTRFDTSNVENMSYMFYSCSGMSDIDVTAFDTSSVTDISHMFDNCTGITSIDVSAFDTSKVKNMYGMFLGCTGLKRLDVSGFDTSNVTNMTHMFTRCSSLTTLDIGTFDTSSVTSMGYMFSGCSNLVRIDLSGLNTSSNTSMKNMFDDCKSLRQLDLSSFDTSSVDDMENLFGGCESLTSLDLTSFDTSSVTNMRYMFSGCKKLTTLDVSSFDTSGVTKMERMFSVCPELGWIDLSGFDMSSVLNCSNMFLGSNAISSYILNVTSNSVTLDGGVGLNFYVKPCDELAKIVISGPNGETTFTDFDDYAEDDGRYKLPYYLNMAQSCKDVTLQAFTSDGRSLIVCNKDGQLLDHSKADMTLAGYLDNAAKGSEDQKLSSLITALGNYCRCADQYFNHTKQSFDEPSLDDKDLEYIGSKKMQDETGVCKISIVLNSRTDIRIYYSGEENTAKYGDRTITAQQNANGKYFEITSIGANQHGDEITLEIGGKKVTFCALSYVQRVLNNDDTSISDVKKLCKMFYLYGKAAKEYKDSLTEE